MKPPIIIDETGDVDIFESVVEAEQLPLDFTVPGSLSRRSNLSSTMSSWREWKQRKAAHVRSSTDVPSA
jgi:hypothetical protein